MNIKKAKHVHFTGIKGVGMTSLALCALDLGIKVTGSDVAEEFVTNEILRSRGIGWKVDFSKDNLNPKPDLVVYTGAHGGVNNPEVLAAQEKGIPAISHAEALGQMAKGKKTIAVCGVGGKTTTCAMIATILEHAGLKPSYAIGVGNISSTGTPGKYNKDGEYFICEADEFAISPGTDNRPRWSYLSPKVIVVTNLEHDHPDIYSTLEDTKRAFKKFFEKLPPDGLLVANADSKNITQEILKNVKSKQKWYGSSLCEACETMIYTPQFFEKHTNFVIGTDMQTYSVILRVPGIFNCYNATAAFLAALQANVSKEVAVEGLGFYEGCKRRFEKISEVNGILFYDDYAHHPEQIKATLKAAREWFPDSRIIALFQPHTYSRTQALFDEFANSFSNADTVGIMDVFSSARETDTLGVSGKLLGNAVEKVHKDGGYAGGEKEIIDYLVAELKPGDIFITLGAGDVYKIHKKLIRELEIRD